MSNERCPNCLGATLVYVAGKTKTCPTCKGTGSIVIKAPVKQKIMIVGEAWGKDEAAIRAPFVGASGSELNRMLAEAGIRRNECYLTNVFNLQPQPSNDVLNLCGSRDDDIMTDMPPLAKGKYVLEKYRPEIQRLWQEVADVQPNLIIALGNTPMWALTGQVGIGRLRGAPAESTHPAGFKVIGTYHPTAVLRDWSLRPVVVADLHKCARQYAFPEVRRPQREIWLDPTIQDIQRFYDQFVIPAKKLSIDIETAGQTQITCVGFAPMKDRAIVIPFVDWRKPNGCYWQTAHMEKLAWQLVAKYCAHEENPDCEVLGQNFLYDINWLLTKVGIRINNFRRDTMLRHHALNPELEKSLGFLGSVYTDEPAWKLMRSKNFGSTKRGDE